MLCASVLCYISFKACVTSVVVLCVVFRLPAFFCVLFMLAIHILSLAFLPNEPPGALWDRYCQHRCILGYHEYLDRIVHELKYNCDISKHIFKRSFINLYVKMSTREIDV